MANTYTQIHLHIVFAVKYRECLINRSWSEELYKYITGIVQNNNHKMLAINGMPDHVHLLIGMRPAQSISDLLNYIKSNSAKWINEKKILKERFQWQEGYGAFSCSKSHMKNVIEYIENQEKHHQKHTFKEEYIDCLKKQEIEFEEKYIFKELLSFNRQ